MSPVGPDLQVNSSVILVLLAWAFAAGAFWMSTRGIRREIHGIRHDLNGMGSKVDRFRNLWRDMLIVMLDNANEPTQRSKITKLLQEL